MNSDHCRTRPEAQVPQYDQAELGLHKLWNHLRKPGPPGPAQEKSCRLVVERGALARWPPNLALCALQQQVALTITSPAAEPGRVRDSSIMRYLFMALLGICKPRLVNVRVISQPARRSIRGIYVSISASAVARRVSGTGDA